METENKLPKNYFVPASILLAGIFIAGAVVYSNGTNAPQQGVSAQGGLSSAGFASGSVENIQPITADDHILGNPNAPVKLVEFSDTECPFCKSFHPTMHQLIEEFGESGQVAWVYRHFPLDQIHSKARKEAQALECAGELGGNTAFWAYTDRLFEIAPSNDNLDLSLLPMIATEVGLDKTQFESCISGDTRGGKYAAHIEENYQDAIASGGGGTPYTVVIAPNGQKFPVSGAQPYSAVKQVVEAALKLK